MRKYGKAPYNFIPLNEDVVKAHEIPSFDKYHEDRYSGFIGIEIETVTPLYIRRIKESSDFFEIEEKPKIPGSSLRGMVRTLVEIASFGKFKFYDNRRLYYRAVADRTSLGKNYRYHFLEGNFKNPKIGLWSKVESGILKKEGDKYKIYSSEKIKGVQHYRINGRFQQYRINGSDNKKKLRKFIANGIEMKLFDFKEIYFKPEESKVYNHSKGHLYLRYALVKDISENEKEGYRKGFLVSSGYISRKHMQWIINPPGEHSEILDDELLEEYKRDEGRDEKADVLKMLEKHPEGVPVFYIRDTEGKIKAFGYTGFFRLPYKLQIKDHIPEDLKKYEDATDFAEAIFGVESKWATRVFFEDAELIEGQDNIYLPETSPRILSSPKPTTFQHYLEQPEGKNTPKQKLKHWNDKEARIRGYKLYWHRNTPDLPRGNNGKYSWNEGKIKKSKLHTRIKPIKRGVRFKSRIRFENLTKEELGALLFVLKLPKNCYHKLGMGKPLGLGSVKIMPTLYIINRKERYKSLFDNDYWNEAKKKEEADGFIRAFENYILKNISKEDKSIWDTSRLKQLKEMLDWSNTEKSDWLERTRYMMIECDPAVFKCVCNPKNNIKTKKRTCNEFKDRPVLPKANEVIIDD